MQAAPMGDPGKPPASKAAQKLPAVSVPSFLAPILTRMNEAGVGPVACRTSSRVMRILTGRPVALDSRAAVGSR